MINIYSNNSIPSGGGSVLKSIDRKDLKGFFINVVPLSPLYTILSVPCP
jgi:hypothetical protein